MPLPDTNHVERNVIYGLPVTYIQDLLLQTAAANYQSAVCFFCFLKPVNYENFKDCLNNQEKEYFDTLRCDKRKIDFLAGRYAAKMAICRITKETDFQSINIIHGIFNQPVTLRLPNTNIQASISHTDCVSAAIAFPAEVSMGIDIEKIDPDTRAVLTSQATDKERRVLKHLTSPFVDMLTLLWTAKESLSKALRIGLTASYSIFEVEGIETGPDHFISHFKHFHQYSAMSFNLLNCMCSIAYPSQTEIKFDVKALREFFRQAPQ